jgi:hypothetical protein
LYFHLSQVFRILNFKMFSGLKRSTYLDLWNSTKFTAGRKINISLNFSWSFQSTLTIWYKLVVSQPFLNIYLVELFAKFYPSRQCSFSSSSWFNYHRIVLPLPCLNRFRALKNLTSSTNCLVKVCNIFLRSTYLQ